MSGSAPEFTCSMHRQVQLKAVVTYTDGSTATLAPGRYGSGSEAWSVVAKPTQVTISSTGEAKCINDTKAVQGGKFRLTLTPYRSLDASKVFVGECTGNFEEDAWLSGATVQMSSSHDGWKSVPKFSHTQDPLINSGNRYTIENKITADLEDSSNPNILYKVYAHQYETDDALLYQGTGRAVYVEMYETHPYGYDYPYGGIKSFITGTYGPWGESETVTVASDRMTWHPGM